MLWTSKSSVAAAWARPRAALVLALTLAGSAGLAACGQKGPLTLPKQGSAAPAAPTASAPAR